MKKLVARSVSVLLVAVGAGAFTVTPAHAYADYIQVCNSSKSTTPIQAYAVHGPFFAQKIEIGRCSTVPDSYNGVGNRIRVDTEYGPPAIKSYWKIKGWPDSGVQSCVNGDNDRSDPWSEYNGQVTSIDNNGVYCP